MNTLLFIIDIILVSFWSYQIGYNIGRKNEFKRIKRLEEEYFDLWTE